MAITYKDINQLSQKSSVAGTEKLPVSDTQYITPSQITANSVRGDGVNNVVALTTDAYDDLGTKDSSTVYVITDDTEIAENVANKVTSISSLSTNTQYPSAKLLYDQLALKQDTLTFDSTPTSASTNPVTSGGVYTELASRPKYYLCASEAEYTGITTKDSSTLYLIPKT